MKATLQLNASDQSIQVNGVLTVETVPQLRIAGTRLLKKTSEPVFDLEYVERYDSSALALLTAWTRDAKRVGKQARFTHVPPNLKILATLSHLDKVLELETSPSPLREGL